VQKHIEGDRVAVVSLHLYRVPILRYYYYYYYYLLLLLLLILFLIFLI